MSVSLMVQTLSVQKSIVHEIVMNDMQIRKMSAKMVPKVLINNQKLCRVKMCQENLDTCESDLCSLENMITVDESWKFEYDSETKKQSAKWYTTAFPRLKKARMRKLGVKTMFIIFLLYQGGHVHHRFLQEFHLEQSCKHQILFGGTEETKAKGQSRLIRHRHDWKLHYVLAQIAFLVTLI